MSTVAHSSTSAIVFESGSARQPVSHLCRSTCCTSEVRQFVSVARRGQKLNRPLRQCNAVFKHTAATCLWQDLRVTAPSEHTLMNVSVRERCSDAICSRSTPLTGRAENGARVGFRAGEQCGLHGSVLFFSRLGSVLFCDGESQVKCTRL